MKRDLKLTPYRALIVDDEPAIRELLAKTLQGEGFQCEVAENGAVAWECARNAMFDIVITDLAMPVRHGHALSVELLALPNPPLVVILTGVLEPRLAKDLMARGVDDIVFKPVDFEAFAAKMRGHVNRRLLSGDVATHKPTPPPKSQTVDGYRQPRISTDQFRARLRELSSIPAISGAAFEVYKLTSSFESTAVQVSSAVQREPALVADILRLANSAFFNPSGKRISDIEQAVVRLGQKRVGELAITTAAAAAIAKESVAFLPLEIIWRRCLAGGICSELLFETSKFDDSRDGLFLAAVMQPMGSIILAAMFPDLYQKMLKQSVLNNTPICELEWQVFTRRSGEVAAELLSLWGLPTEIHQLLRYTSLSFRALGDLPEAMRRRVEFVKTATFFGELVAPHYEPWDLIDLPPDSVSRRLGIQSLDELLRQCRDDLENVADWTPGAPRKTLSHEPSLAMCPPRQLAYRRLNVTSVDVLPYILASDHVRLVRTARDVCEAEAAMVVNCTGASLPQVMTQMHMPASGELLIFADAEQADRLRHYGHVVSFPCSFGTLHNAINAIPSSDRSVQPQ